MPTITAGRIGGGWLPRQALTVALGLGLAGPAAFGLDGGAPEAKAPEPIVYRIRVPEPATHFAEVELGVATEGRPVLDLRMPVWSPGFYRVEDHAARMSELTARDERGALLPVTRTRPNQWRVEAGPARQVRISYRLLCDQRSVTTNWISNDLAVLNGAATFLAVIGSSARPHEVWLEGPPSWKRTATALEPAAEGSAGHYGAPDYDALVDSPIVAGDLDVREFSVEGRPHRLVDVGDRSAWDGGRAARELEQMARAAARFWRVVPFEGFWFLNVFREGGGGLEHRASTLLTANAARTDTPAGYRRWLEFATHEYLHAWNVKRLRPVELGPFDYEEPPRTRGLWISEGLTSYCADLVLARGGLRSREDFLASLSAQIEALQKQPGRLRQTVEDSSLEVWSNSLSGIDPNADSVSYYVKGHVLAFLLDARIRHATEGRGSLDQLMRLAYARYAGERGFTGAQFEAVATEVAGTDLGPWFQSTARSAAELDYAPALDWFGLRFAPPGGSGTDLFRLEVRPDAGEPERTRLRALLQED